MVDPELSKLGHCSGYKQDTRAYARTASRAARELAHELKATKKTQGNVYRRLALIWLQYETAYELRRRS